MSFSHRRSIRLSRSVMDGTSTTCPLLPSTPNSFIVEEDEEAGHRLRVLLGTTWKLKTVSPLYTFKQDGTLLKKYESVINQELLNLKAKDTHYKVTIELCPDLSVSENDDVAFRLKILSKTKRIQKNFYEGIFLSWRNANERKFQNQPYVHLPLLLCNGSVRNIRIVHGILSSLLDCIFGNFTLSQNDCKWLSSIALSCVPNESGSIGFTYCSVDGRNKTLNLKMNLDTLISIWDLIKDGERITLHDVMKLFAALQEHVLNTYNVNTDCYVLKSVSFSKNLSMDNTGKIRSNSATMMDLLLKYCTSICMSRRLIDKNAGNGI